MNMSINVATRSKDYQTLTPSIGKEEEGTPSSSTPSGSGPLHIERPNPNSIVRPPSRGVLQKSSYNLNAQATQHYNIFEYLAKVPSTISTLEVLQSCPPQWKSLLTAIGGIDPTNYNLLCFDLENHIPRLPHQIAFLI